MGGHFFLGGLSAFIARFITGDGTRSRASMARFATLVLAGVPRPNQALSGPPVGSSSTCIGGLPSAAPRALEMTIRWISLVPSKIV